MKEHSCKLNFWQSRQSGISGTGYFICVSRKTANMGWQVEANHVNHVPEEWVGVMKLWNYIYTGNNVRRSVTVSISQLEPQPCSDRSRTGRHPWQRPQRTVTENLSSIKRCKALNMESQCGLSEDPLRVCVRVLRLLVSASISYLQFRHFLEIKRDIYFCLVYITVSSFLHHGIKQLYHWPKSHCPHAIDWLIMLSLHTKDFHSFVNII